MPCPPGRRRPRRARDDLDKGIEDNDERAAPRVDDAGDAQGLQEGRGLLERLRCPGARRSGCLGRGIRG